VKKKRRKDFDLFTVEGLEIPVIWYLNKIGTGWDAEGQSHPGEWIIMQSFFFHYAVEKYYVEII
jgi:hypothetical protein